MGDLLFQRGVISRIYGNCERGSFGPFLSIRNSPLIVCSASRPVVFGLFFSEICFCCAEDFS